MDNHKNDERIGLVSATLTTISFLPQSVLVWRDRPAPAESVSLLTFTIFCFGVMIWIWYGTRIKRPIVIWANTISLLIGISILAYKLIYG